MVSAVGHFLLSRESRFLEAPLPRGLRCTEADAPLPLRYVIQPEQCPLLQTLHSLHWNMFPAGAVQVASSNVSLHGNTEFTSSGASVGGKPIRIDANIPTVPARVNITLTCIPFTVVYALTYRSRWEAGKFDKIPTVESVLIENARQSIMPREGRD